MTLVSYYLPRYFLRNSLCEFSTAACTSGAASRPWEWDPRYTIYDFMDQSLQHKVIIDDCTKIYIKTNVSLYYISRKREK